MTHHDLKTWPAFFAAVHDGRKTFEVRRNDRGFQAGDVLVLREWDPQDGTYTGRVLTRSVLYVLHAHDGLVPGFVVMGLGAEQDETRTPSEEVTTRERRDSGEDDCEAFTTDKGQRVLVDCAGDGHYRCRECACHTAEETPP